MDFDDSSSSEDEHGRAGRHPKQPSPPLSPSRPGTPAGGTSSLTQDSAPVSSRREAEPHARSSSYPGSGSRWTSEPTGPFHPQGGKRSRRKRRRRPRYRPRHYSLPARYEQPPPLPPDVPQRSRQAPAAAGSAAQAAAEAPVASQDPARPFTCPSCGKTYTTKYNCHRHIKAQHTSQPHAVQCSDCGKKFIRKSYCVNHQRRFGHTGMTDLAPGGPPEPASSGSGSVPAQAPPNLSSPTSSGPGGPPTGGQDFVRQPPADRPIARPHGRGRADRPQHFVQGRVQALMSKV